MQIYIDLYYTCIIYKHCHLNSISDWFLSFKFMYILYIVIIVEHIAKIVYKLGIKLCIFVYIVIMKFYVRVFNSEE